MTACAASAKIPLAEKEEVISVIPSDLDPNLIEETAKHSDNLVFIKCAYRLKDIIPIVMRSGFTENSTIALIRRCTMPEEEVLVGKLRTCQTGNITEDYFSVAIIKNISLFMAREEVHMNKVVFIGAGPGDPELITLKGKSFEQADIVIYTGSLLNPEYLKYCKKGAELYDSAKMGLPEMLKVMVEGVKAGKQVVRLHDGDPSFYGAIQEHNDDSR